MGQQAVLEMAASLNGTITEMGALPDGSGFAVMALPLPADHWLTRDPDAFNVPPMPLRMGTSDPRREVWTRMLTEAGRYAVRSATDNGKLDDFDPDALVQNLITGMLGYNTPNGLSADEWANPRSELTNA